MSRGDGVVATMRLAASRGGNAIFRDTLIRLLQSGNLEYKELTKAA